jgi:hypothetical protein
MNKKVKNLTFVTVLTFAIVSVGGIFVAPAVLIPNNFLIPADAVIAVSHERGEPKAPVVVSGDNIYIAWWTNNTENGNEEVMFRASTDAGATFGDKINLSNSSEADSWRVEIHGEGDNVVVSWWETNQTSDTPVARVSNDAGETFGPLVMLAANGTLGSGEAEEVAVVEEEGGE